MRYERLGNLFVPKNIVRGGFRKYLDIGTECSVKFKGRFKVELLDDRGRVKKCLEFDNLITDAGLNFINNNTIAVCDQYAAVGTGSTAPTTSDTTLQAEITPSSSNRTNQNGGITETLVYTSGATDFWTSSKTYLFDFAQGNGNLTEIGLFSASSSGTMWTRQLLKDSGGTPTTIVKTSSDQLRITYTLQIYPPTADVTGSITISGNSYSTTIRAANANHTSNWDTLLQNGMAFADNRPRTSTAALAARTTQPGGTLTNATSSVRTTYVSGNFYIESTDVWSISGGSATVLSALVLGNASGGGGSEMQIGFSPGLPKTNTNQLTMVNRYTWGRYP